jgi:hypothetical protein
MRIVQGRDTVALNVFSAEIASIFFCRRRHSGLDDLIEVPTNGADRIGTHFSQSHPIF